MIQTAHRLGIASELQPNASIALGTSEVTPLELVDGLCALRQWRHRRAVAYHHQGAHGGRQAALRPQGVEQRPRDRSDLCGDDEFHAGADAGHRHRARRRICRAGRRRARPAPARITATPGSSATPASSSPGSGSATTTIRRPKRPPAPICRWKSGRATCATPCAAWWSRACRPAAGAAKALSGGPAASLWPFSQPAQAPQPAPPAPHMDTSNPGAPILMTGAGRPAGPPPSAGPRRAAMVLCRATMRRFRPRTFPARPPSQRLPPDPDNRNILEKLFGG